LRIHPVCRRAITSAICNPKVSCQISRSCRADRLSRPVANMLKVVDRDAGRYDALSILRTLVTLLEPPAKCPQSRLRICSILDPERGAQLRLRAAAQNPLFRTKIRGVGPAGAEIPSTGGPRAVEGHNHLGWPKLRPAYFEVTPRIGSNSKLQDSSQVSHSPVRK
jgi:hypothetical protein